MSDEVMVDIGYELAKWVHAIVLTRSSDTLVVRLDNGEELTVSYWVPYNPEEGSVCRHL